MTNIDSVDFFTDNELLSYPYDYLAGLRSECPLRREKHHDVVMVTGYDEGMAIYNDTDRFSSCISVTGPFPGFPVPLEGLGNEDISGLITAHRDELPFYDQLPTFDPPVHTAHRALLSRMITPKRLKLILASARASGAPGKRPSPRAVSPTASNTSPRSRRCVGPAGRRTSPTP